MRIKLSGVFLSGSVVEVKRKGVSEKRFLAKFHQPKESDNSLISLVFPVEAEGHLEQYASYEMDGVLNTWVFNNQVQSRIEVSDFLAQ